MNAAAWTGMALLALVGLLVGWLLAARATKAGIERLRTERDTLVADRVRFQTQGDELRRLGEEQKAEMENLRSQCATLSSEAARAQEQLKAAQAALASERELLAGAKEKLTDTFKSLAGDILKENNAQFLGIANREFSAKEQAIDTLLKPVKESLDKLNVQTQQLEVKREGAYSDVLAQVKNIQQTHETLRQETTQLVQALRAPKARGNWGELQLKRCVEFAGLVEHCSFETEVFMRGDQDAAQRPDVVVRLPNGRAIVIDAKTPLDAYLSAMSAADEMQRAMYLKAHATQVRTHLSQLGSKQYWQRFENSPDFVVCFLPSEVLFSAALEQDPSLIEVGSQLNVILATPTTLIALLKAVAYGWQQMKITRNAMAICEEADKLYKKLTTAQKYFVNLGKALASCTAHYNYLVDTVVEGRGGIFTQSRKLHELGVGAEELPETRDVEAPIRQLQSEDWQVQDDSEPIALAAAEEASKQ